MKLGELLERVPPVDIGADQETAVSSLAYDSRRVKPGCVFFAIQGEKTDGHRFIAEALERGAVAVASEREAPEGLRARWVQVPKVRRALAEAARKLYDDPDLKLQLIGITGTNGKTTTAYLLNSILQAAGLQTGMFGTIEHRVGGRVIPALNTTPESLDLVEYFNELVEGGAKAAVMEVSSHALAQERVWGLHFSAAVFTNLTRDHLDYHGDFERYFAAKRRLFEGEGTRAPELAVINTDDPWGHRLLDLAESRQITYGIESSAEVRAKQFSQGASGLSAKIATPQGEMQIESALLGRVNLMNILAATATAVGLGFSAESIQEGVRNLAAVPGRFQKIDEGQPFLVVVDYAHTDDALQNVLQAARDLAKNRLIVVFGCGGERDRTKRPVMGEVAGRLSDLAVLTSDNPRGEDPILIMNDALVGLQKTGKPYLAEVDREVAIQKALEQAREGDAVVLAGKGHETYQILNGRTIPFDDREVARAVLRNMGFDAQGEKNPNSHR
ncbi:MAG TPA: UDP-N-acetylmuramoyl-L-alanyl-D-glutamate--2,6-diaminopimelate ligase [Terriglobia bacterium]|nr:UDP-N-acetylmuramoyl-L-alanyl-D-glutamate--2,6-diaminopimelate ligase [Terriglobia bacterium]